MQRLNLARLPWILLILVSIVVGAVACGNTPQPEPSPVVSSPIPPTATSEELTSPILPTEAAVPPTALAPQSDLGGARGVLVSYPPAWNGRQLYMYFAPFYSSETEGEGFYVLEPSVHPVAEVAAGGTFQLNDIPPAQYVILGGPAPEDAQPIRQGDKPEIFDIVAGEILDLGDVQITP